MKQLVLRLVEAVAIVVLLATAVFLALRIVPGDAALLVLGDHASPEALAELRAKLHLNEPMVMQYGRFLHGMAFGDFGESLRKPGVTASARVFDALGPTASLAFTSVFLGALLGTLSAVLGAGPWLGRARGWIERALVAVASFPLLALAPLLTWVLAIRLRTCALPGDPDAGAPGTLFAASLLAIPLAAHVGRIGLASLSHLGRAQFLLTARAKGASTPRTWILHALPNALGPIVTVVATQLGALLGGALVLERLFERPGLGSLILEAYASRDIPVLQAAIVASGGLFVIAQMGATAVHAWVDPRARSAA